VSLILDALKKLEREKDAREPGVLVVGSVPWGARARSRAPLATALTALGVVALVAFALWPRSRPVPKAASPSPRAASTAVPAAGPAPATPAPPAVPAAASPSVAPPPDPRRLSLPLAAEEAPAPSSAAPAGERTPGADDLQLNAISQRDGRPIALINDHLVFEGDSFDGVRILRIGETEVEVEVRGKRRVLRF
jgi:hypothetical protein